VEHGLRMLKKVPTSLTWAANRRVGSKSGDCGKSPSAEESDKNAANAKGCGHWPNKKSRDTPCNLRTQKTTVARSSLVDTYKSS